MTDDERLDQRIHDVLDLAGSDAPPNTSGPLGARQWRARTRVLAVAAALALAVAASVALGARRNEGQPQAIPATFNAHVDSTVAQSSGDPTVPDGPRCTLPKIGEYDEMGTMHTVVPNTRPLDGSVTVESGGPYCSGDSVVITVTVHNRGVGIETVAPRVILAGGANKYPVAALPAFDLQPAETLTRSLEVILPAAPPGDYWLGLYGFGDIANITLANPPLCDETRIEPRFTSDGAGGTLYTFITLPNVSKGPCLLGPVRWVGAIIDGVEQGLATPDALNSELLPPLRSPLLQPGESAGLVVVTTNACLDGTVLARPIGVLALHLSMGGTPLTIDLRDSPAQTACSFAMSSWGGAPR